MIDDPPFPLWVGILFGVGVVILASAWSRYEAAAARRESQRPPLAPELTPTPSGTGTTGEREVDDEGRRRARRQEVYNVIGLGLGAVGVIPVIFN